MITALLEREHITRTHLPAGTRARITALVGVTATACLTTLLWPDLLTGPVAMNASAKGTALVAVVVAVPVLAIAAWRASTGGNRALVVATGVTAFLTYNALLFCFATPFNRAFLVYVAMLGVAIWSLAGLALALWQRVDSLAGPVPGWVAAYLGFIVVANTYVWLAAAVPAVLAHRPTDALDGMGLATNPVWVQDLAFWLPAMGWLAWGVWRRHPQRTALAAAGLAFWTLEAVSVAVDQWWGHHADPASRVVAPGAVPMFAVLAMVGFVPTLRALRAVRDPGIPANPIDATHGLLAARTGSPSRFMVVGAVVGTIALTNLIGALGGAVGLATGVLHLDQRLEARLPWDSPVLGAVALALLVGLPNLVLLALTLRRDARAPAAAVAVGVGLVLWILVELAFLRELSFLHPLYAGVGLLMVLAGLSWQARSR